MDEKIKKIEQDIANIKMYIELGEDKGETFDEIITRLQKWKKEATR